MGISGSSLLILAAKEVPKMKKNRKKKNNWTKVRKEKLGNPETQRKCPFLEKKNFSHACSKSSNISKAKIILKSDLYSFIHLRCQEILWSFFRYKEKFDWKKNLVDSNATSLKIWSCCGVVCWFIQLLCLRACLVTYDICTYSDWYDTCIYGFSFYLMSKWAKLVFC